LARKKASRKRSSSPTRRTSAVLDQFSAADLDRWDQLSRAEPSSFGIPAPNQIFGYLAKEAGFEALLYPSQQTGRLCLAVFNENFAGAGTTSSIRVRGVPPVGVTQIVLDRHSLCL
jgi:hypothetical protein